MTERSHPALEQSTSRVDEEVDNNPDLSADTSDYVHPDRTENASPLKEHRAFREFLKSEALRRIGMLIMPLIVLATTYGHIDRTNNNLLSSYAEDMTDYARAAIPSAASTSELQHLYEEQAGDLGISNRYWEELGIGEDLDIGIRTYYGTELEDELPTITELQQAFHVEPHLAYAILAYRSKYKVADKGKMLKEYATNFMQTSLGSTIDTAESVLDSGRDALGMQTKNHATREALLAVADNQPFFDQLPYLTRKGTIGSRTYGFMDMHSENFADAIMYTTTADPSLAEYWPQEYLDLCKEVRSLRRRIDREKERSNKVYTEYDDEYLDLLQRMEVSASEHADDHRFDMANTFALLKYNQHLLQKALKEQGYRVDFSQLSTDEQAIFTFLILQGADIGEGMDYSRFNPRIDTFSHPRQMIPNLLRRFFQKSPEDMRRLHESSTENRASRILKTIYPNNTPYQYVEYVLALRDTAAKE